MAREEAAREAALSRNYPHLHHTPTTGNDGLSSTIVRMPYDSEIQTRGRPPSLSGQQGAQNDFTPGAADADVPWSV